MRLLNEQMAGGFHEPVRPRASTRDIITLKPSTGGLPDQDGKEDGDFGTEGDPARIAQYRRAHQYQKTYCGGERSIPARYHAVLGLAGHTSTDARTMGREADTISGFGANTKRPAPPARLHSLATAHFKPRRKRSQVEFSLILVCGLSDQKAQKGSKLLH